MKVLNALFKKKCAICNVEKSVGQKRCRNCGKKLK